MHPPPSTPTPRRFLLPKRGTQTSSQTPTAARAPAGTPRFQSTPRFGAAAGSSSVVKPLGRRAVSQEIEDVDVDADGEEERVVSSSVGEEERVVSSSFGDEDMGRMSRERPRLGDDIIEDGEEQEGALWIEGVDVVPGSESPVERRVKRRRVSLSEEMTSSPAPEELPQALTEEEDGKDDGVGKDQNGSEIWAGSEEEEEEDVDPAGRDIPTLQQPTFRAAPRFKPTEGDIAAESLLPVAFSPQRRGAKYVPGGLAAELQGWLSDVKRWDEDGGEATMRERFRVYTKEVSRDGERMYLVKGQEGERYILAGEGRLTGLRRRAVVSVGMEIEVEGPVWEVELEGARWLVCCEWSVI